MKNKTAKSSNNSNEKKEDDNKPKRKDDLANHNEIARLVIYFKSILLWPGAKCIMNILITQEE